MTHDEQNDLRGDLFSSLTIRPTVTDVDLDALSHNFRLIRDKVTPAKVIAVLKANAYGHGLITCGTHLEQIGADALGVALVEEGIQLRKTGVSLPILILGSIFGEQIKHYLEYDLDLMASSVTKIQAIEQTAKSLNKRAKVHLKIDTGMERVGVHHYTAETLFEAALQCEHCDIVGVFSHFATAEEKDSSFVKLQLERFFECLTYYSDRGLPVPRRHMANSAALLTHPESHLDMVRVGLCLYGVYPETWMRGLIDLQPVMTLRSRVVYFKVVKKGAGVSYGHTWRAPNDTRVVTIPIGYGDGYFRSLSNKGSVLIRGKRFPIVGSVCMDQIMVDIGEGEAYNGDEVVLIGKQNSDSISVNEVADVAGTVPHEVLTSTNARVPRRYLRDGKEWEVNQ